MSTLASVLLSKSNRDRVCHTAISAFVCLLTIYDGLANGSMMALLSGIFLFYTSFDSILTVLSSAYAVTTPSHALPYGTARLNVLLTYANGCMFIFFCLSTIVEGIEKLLSKHTSTQSPWLLIAQLLVHVSFEMFLSVSANSLLRRCTRRCSVVVLAATSSFFVQYTGSHKIDVVFGVFTALMSAYLVWPQQRSCCDVLLQKAPRTMMASLDKAKKNAQACDGVLAIEDEKYWAVRENELVGTMRVRVKSGVDSQEILEHVKHSFKNLLSHITVQVEADGTLSQDILNRMAKVPALHRQTVAKPSFIRPESRPKSPGYRSPVARSPVTFSNTTAPSGHVQSDKGNGYQHSHAHQNHGHSHSHGNQHNGDDSHGIDMC
ncbi:Metal tolerance protein 8 [Diplonema papillatum]|nr:Metal tolerance protein 8 [Diplonema papillatum]